MTSILLIDDDEYVVELISKVLTQRGYYVFQAGNGEEGIALLEAHHREIDIIVCDLLMPVKEGIETIIEIRKLRFSHPIIAISGGGRNNRQDILDAAKKLGATAILPKPFRPKELIALFEDLLNVSRLKTEATTDLT